MNKQLTTTICKDQYCPKILSATFLHSNDFDLFYPEKRGGRIVFSCCCVYFLRSIKKTAIAIPASIATVDPAM